MKIFKESTHSLKEDLTSLLESKEDILLKLLGLTGTAELAGNFLKKDSLKAIYDKLPENLKSKISEGENLSNFEKLQETEIARKELRIPVRPSFESLESLNEYYRQTNPLGKS